MAENKPMDQMELLTPVQRMIAEECDALKTLLIEKNKSYGNSAIEPIRCFSRASSSEGIRIRIDDKLSRLCRGNNYQDEDCVQDLLGYGILLRIAERIENEKTIKETKNV